MSILSRASLTGDAEYIIVDEDPLITSVDCSKSSLICWEKVDDADLYLKTESGDNLSVKKVS